jgi:hypothetical protein
MNVGDPWDDEFELMNSIALLSYPVHVHSHLRPLMARVGACGPDNLGGLSQAQESPGGCRGPAGRKLCLPKARVPPRASRRDFPIHAGSLGPHRAHAGHNACGPRVASATSTTTMTVEPTSMRRCAEATTPDVGTLRQRGGSKPFARTTRSAGFQLNHTTGVVPNPVSNPDYHHQVLGGDKAGTVARGLPAGLPAGWNGR